MWAVPAIAEPLRQVRVVQSSDRPGPLESISSSIANGEELQLQIESPQSPVLQAMPFGPPSAGSGRGPSNPAGMIGGDIMAMTVPGAPLGGPVMGGDPMAMSVPAVHPMPLGIGPPM